MQRDDVPREPSKFKEEARRPSLADLEQLLVKLPSQLEFDHMYMVVDALDECPKEQRPQIIHLFKMVMDTLPCVKLFVTSRKEGDIERAFTQMRTPTIQMKAENVAADIRSYVESEVKRLRDGYHGNQLFLSNDSLETQIIDTLTEKAEGM